MNTNKEKHSWLTGLLTGWGIKESWAKVIAGMVIGALAAAGLLSSCTASYSQSASGDIQFSGTVVVPQKYSK
ncbi:MAG: hypothetical protein IJB64_07405 [Akkermansia sp.]|nr:hypothetical protein [Akkermansia sp.]